MKSRLFSLLSSLLIFLLMNPRVQAQDKAVKVACIGNSVTYGFGIENREHECYPSKLQLLLGKNYYVRNFGHSGATLLRKGHNPYYKTVEFASAISFKPDIAIIHLGLNDTDPRDWPYYRLDFEADYSWLISEIRKANPAVKIYICRLTPIFSGHPRFKSGTRDWYDRIQQLIPKIAKANHTGLIDLHTPLYHRPDLFADNIHPNAEGAGILAGTAYHVLTQNFGGLKLPEVFADNMVLQRGEPITVYGTDNGGKRIEVSLGRYKLTAMADSDGKWRVIFAAMRAGGPYQIKIKDSDTAIAIKNILVGDVWLCSGQSNMAFPLNRSAGGKEELENTTPNKRLRLYQLKVLAETDRVAWDTTVLKKVNRLQYFSGKWQTPDSSSAAVFSAVAYYFGKKIASEEHIPIGLIEVAVGGSPIESWIDRYTMEHDNLLVDMLNNWRKSDFEMKFCRDRADTNLMLANSARQRHPYEPCYNYEAGIRQLVGFPIKGILWYQGESNAHNAELYEHLFPLLVNSWRQKLGARLPLYYVQLSGIDRPSWPIFRDMERCFQKHLPRCHMAVSMDVGDSLNVHYTQKKPVGERLALLALHYTYYKPVVADGPEALSAVKAGNCITVTFSKGQQLTTSDRRALRGFELVNIRGQRMDVKAAIKKNTALISIPRGEDIRSVWYAMQPFTRANLANKYGLPASSFTIDLSNNTQKRN